MNFEILIGSLLGDAYVPKLYGRSKTHSIWWEHSQAQRDYALWKAESSGITYSVYERSRFDKRTNKTYESVTIVSNKEDFAQLRDMFYQDGTKVVTQALLDALTPLAIAVWFCDDGSLYYNGNNCHLELAINSFSTTEQLMIIRYFKERWNVNFKINRKSIRLTSVKEVLAFESAFLSYMPSCMSYKTLIKAKENYVRKKNSSVR